MQRSDVAIFLAVLENESYSRAARTLGLSVATTSRHVAALEERVGVQLLARTTRRVAPTREGSRFAERARRALDDLEDAEAEVRGGATTPRGLVRLSAPPELTHRVIGPAVDDLLATHPELSIEVELAHRRVDLVAERFDLALRLEVPDDSSLVGKKLGSFPLAAMASPAYLARHAAPRRPAGLSGHAFLALAAKAYRKQLRFSNGPRHETVRVEPRFFSNSFQVLRELARSGTGITLLPRPFVEEDLARGDLVRLLDGWLVPGPPLHLVYPRRRLLPASTRAVAARLALGPWLAW